MGRMRRFLFAGAILVPALVLFSSCGDDGDDDTPKSGGTDEEYLAAICKGTSDFSNALLTKTTAAEIGNVIEDFITLMKDANPPADLADYNQEFVKYLEDALADPTSLATKELSVDECKDGTFFSRGLEE